VRTLICLLSGQKALFLIATHGSPSLKEKDRWSAVFIDFMTRCLHMDPRQRASAAELLKVRYLEVFNNVS